VDSSGFWLVLTDDIQPQNHKTLLGNHDCVDDSYTSTMNKTRTIFVLDAGALFVLQILQFFSLDYYVLIVFQDTWYSRYPNILFLVLNIVLTLLFYHTFLNCYREYKYERSKKTGDLVECKAKYPVYLNCITWAMYVTVLFSKIMMIFSNNVISLVSNDDFMGPQMLKVKYLPLCHYNVLYIDMSL